MNRSFPIKIMPFLRGTALKRGAIFGAILVAALLAFEVFNYSTTAFALADVLGDLKFAGLQWSTILAFAFCGIDFAGIARIFTPQQGRDEPAEVWYLFGAWMLAAGFNAMLTWWGVSVAILNHTSAGTALVGQTVLIKAVPVFVAVMVWLIRVLIIGTFSIAGENMFSMAGDQPASQKSLRPNLHTTYQPLVPAQRVQPASSYPRPAPKPLPVNRPMPRPEPSYHPVGMGALSNDENSSVRR
ncbi:MAG: hypothetical protein HYR70_08390 [Chloroflexi bacterium]|nr:hypothetical protein [Chloroflexota bacterium]MBI3339151.1 hypothetical protein [Chloroflexota bacterium]